MRIHPKDMIVGETYYECQSGFNIQFTLKEEVKITGSTHEWVGIGKGGNLINYLSNDDYSAYAPRIYKTPQYATVRNGQFEFNLS